ncbi:MAG TPA: dehydrogenase E1 component subunit alpha/beta [Myxococcota bacterium]|nr:dehydrogenase E1 component subunit alpha/beta [Myxococcota bacterium]
MTASVKQLDIKGEGVKLTAAQRLQIYKTMLTSRRIDDLEIQLKRQNKIYFQISGAGHEATLTAATMHLKSGYDWFFPYYRDRALCLGLGVTPYEMLLEAVGAADDPASGGRQMPSHWGHAEHNIPSQSSPTGTQFLNAVGCAEAGVYYGKLADAAGNKKVREMKKSAKADDGNTSFGVPKVKLREAVEGVAFHDDEVVYVSSGDGTTSEGEFYEALNTACNLKLPVIFHIEDNGYAISVPVEVQTAGASISKLLSGYPNLLRIEFDGCCPEESYAAWHRGVAHARERKGPVLMHSHVVRPYSHSLSDDESFYRAKAERDEDAKRDPIVTYRKRLIDEFDIPEKKIKDIEAQIAIELEEAKEKALTAQPPTPESAATFVFSPDKPATSEQFSSEPLREGDDKTLVDLINACMRDEMARNARIVVFGEDVADASREEALGEVKGKGGVFKVTHGLQRRYGGERVFNSPLAEANIVGRAVGMAMRGMKPVVEIQFFDYIWPAMMQIRSEMAQLRWRSNNTYSSSFVIRTTYGGYLKGGAVFHSQTGESIFAHIPGLRVVLPSNALDANGLLRTAIRCEDPVLFLEHKHLYRQTYNRAPYPGPDFMIPFGKANKVREGKDVTIITYGALVKRSIDAARMAAEKGIDVEILDLRTISPYDWEAISASVKKTNRALIVHEDSLSWGSGAEIVARISDELFAHLDAPVRRVASKDTFVGYHPDLEDSILPQNEDVLAAIESIVAY